MNISARPVDATETAHGQHALGMLKRKRGKGMEGQ
jgi:hypothetical protein